MGPTDLGNHYLQDQAPQVGHTGEITVRVGQAGKTGNGQGSPTVLLLALMSPMRRGLCSKLQTRGPPSGVGMLTDTQAASMTLSSWLEVSELEMWGEGRFLGSVSATMRLGRLQR